MKRYKARTRARRELRLAFAHTLRGGHTAKEWRALVTEFDWRCVRCERKGGRLSKDHIVPLFLGGTDDIANLQPLCRRCNSSKGEETTDWKAYRRAHGWSSVAPARNFSKR